MSQYRARQMLSIVVLYDNYRALLLASAADRHGPTVVPGVEQGTIRTFAM